MPIMDGYEACKQILEIYKLYNDDQLCRKDIKEIQQLDEEDDQIKEQPN